MTDRPSHTMGRLTPDSRASWQRNLMYKNIKTSNLGSRYAVDAVAVAVFDTAGKKPKDLATLEASTVQALDRALARSEVSRAAGVVTPIHGATQRLYLLGLGQPDKRPLDAIRNAASALVRACDSAGVKSLAIHLTPALDTIPKLKLTHADAGSALGEGLSIGQLTFDAFKSDLSKSKSKTDSTSSPARDLTVLLEGSVRTAASRSLTVGLGVNTARSLAATPPNVANPRYLVNHCRAMSKKVGLKFSVIDEARAKQLKMGGLLAVGSAGSTPPAIIVMEHKPRNAKKTAGPVLLVGKAVTFDTGGYSLKPAASMDGMKYDKCGGMAVIGAMQAIAQLKLPIHVVGLVPTAENMVSEKAYRPGDIITLHNGVTVEVTNTDAEGRLILADALSYGCKTYKPSAIVDLATLTGGVVTALGSYCAGCFCHDTLLRSQLFDAGEMTGDRLWHLPLWDEHRQQMKGVHGDLVNSAGREAHPIQGAAFLSYFISKDSDHTRWNEQPWAHLDIAGVADAKSDSPPYPKGPTGFGVRLLVRMIEHWRG